MTAPTPGGVTWRLRALTAMGHPAAQLAAAIGVPPRTVQRLLDGHPAGCGPEVLAAAVTVYDAWWNLRPARRTPAERRAATAALRRAARRDWPCPMALDDDELDEPGYAPTSHWRPALGCGTVTDLHPAFPAGRQYREERTA